VLTCVLKYVFFVQIRIRMQPKFREVGRACFRFSSHEHPVVSNYDDLLYTKENTAAPIGA
jgi:hypothetical protein